MPYPYLSKHFAALTSSDPLLFKQKKDCLEPSSSRTRIAHIFLMCFLAITYRCCHIPPFYLSKPPRHHYIFDATNNSMKNEESQESSEWDEQKKYCFKEIVKLLKGSAWRLSQGSQNVMKIRFPRWKRSFSVPRSPMSYVPCKLPISVFTRF